MPAEQRSLWLARDWNVLLVQSAVLAAAVGARACYWPTPLEAVQAIYPLSLAILLVSVWSIWSWRLVAGRLFDFYQLFLAAVIVFNAGHAWMEALGLSFKNLLRLAFTPPVAVDTLFAVLMGLAGMHWGALLAALGREPRTTAAGNDADPPAQALAAKSLRIVGWAMLVVSLPFFALIVKDAIPVVLSSGYMGLYQREAGVGMNAGPQVLAAFLVPAAMFLFAGGKDDVRLRWLTLGLLLAYAAINYFLGMRYYATIPLVAVALLRHRLVRPLHVGMLAAAGAVLLVVVFPLVRATRESKGTERMTVESFSESFTGLDNPAIAAVQEMGGTVQTVAYTVQHVPDQHAFELGIGYCYAGLTFLPNLFWSLHPTIARGIPTMWLIWTVDPYTAQHGGSLGYSLIAEAYLNFGRWGVPAVMAAIGFGYAWLVLWAERRNRMARLAMVACVACSFTFYARADAATVLRPLVWYALLPYLAATMLQRHWTPVRTADEPAGGRPPEPSMGALGA